jgi:uncharacterized membrane protein
MENDSAPPPAPALPALGWLWFRQHPVFPLLVICLGSSLLSVVLVAVRKEMSGQGSLGFIPFNLILAFLPVLFLLGFERSRKKGDTLLFGALWLLFFPNAPYMLTDLVHFDKKLGRISWLDLLALLAAAWAALLAGMVTLQLMAERVRRRRSPGMAHGFILTVLFLSSIGIYIGRFLRFHSFHVILNPWTLIKETTAAYFQRGKDPMAWAFTLAVFALLACIHYSLVAFSHAANRPQGQAAD